jgi:hypothetical protein
MEKAVEIAYRVERGIDFTTNPIIIGFIRYLIIVATFLRLDI